ncbi:phage antirepressor [Heyndrickxia oleronia]|uniref:Phage antirepressor n=1 Tax=Heyndrickxia oleronia TaxID=38875 RepID=A0AAW6SRK6_9BACI|nr:phage antirepressor [Heyndrickxia oleronia]MDH5159885.1 phage antirepressor [Heyndrickxia oleronia]
MNQITKVFEGSELRLVEIEGSPWFVAKDVCSILGISNPSKATSSLESDEKTTITISYTGSMTTNLVVINEAGLYALIFRSRKPEAREFKRWITHEVIPSIRKHGAYMTPETLGRTIKDPDFLIGLLTNLKDEQQRRLEVEEQNKELKPKAEKYERFLDSDGLTTFTTIGKHFLDGISPQKVRLFLQEEGVIYKRKVDGVFPPTQDYTKYFRIIPYYYYDYYGNEIVTRTVKVTNEGIDFIIDLYQKANQAP